MNKARPYIISILFSLGTGVLSALLTRGNMNIYEEINTPLLSPPSFVFPIVWTVLFILMGISAATVFNSTAASPDKRTRALFTYGLSLLVNLTWSIIFFNLKMYFFAFIWLILLWVLILKTIFEYYEINKTAAFLQIPYLIWVSFAGYLSLAIFLLNK